MIQLATNRIVRIQAETESQWKKPDDVREIRVRSGSHAIVEKVQRKYHKGVYAACKIPNHVGYNAFGRVDVLDEINYLRGLSGAPHMFDYMGTYQLGEKFRIYIRYKHDPFSRSFMKTSTKLFTYKNRFTAHL